MSSNLWKWSKLLYSIPLSITGLIYIFKPQGTVETLTSFLPGGLGLIYFFGALWLILGLCIAFSFQTRYAAWGIIVLLTVIQMLIHIPAAYAGEYLNIVWFELLRDLSLMGGAFFILAADSWLEKESSSPQSTINSPA